jgi:hypothetical protein
MDDDDPLLVEGRKSMAFFDRYLGDHKGSPFLGALGTLGHYLDNVDAGKPLDAVIVLECYDYRKAAALAAACARGEPGDYARHWEFVLLKKASVDAGHSLGRQFMAIIGEPDIRKHEALWLEFDRLIRDEARKVRQMGVSDPFNHSIH